MNQNVFITTPIMLDANYKEEPNSCSFVLFNKCTCTSYYIWIFKLVWKTGSLCLYRLFYLLGFVKLFSFNQNDPRIVVQDNDHTMEIV